jgi:ATP-binding cassette subfamily C protein
VGYVPQDPFLFNDSIRENLRRFHPDATDEDLREALNLSGAEDFVALLPEGINTLIGDRGVKLSGGERQRIVLARALLKKPQVLILDEATSSLDNENESKIRQAIESLREKLTIIVIAHRLSTVLQSDRVFVVENGTIVETGSGQELIGKPNSYFHKMYDNNLQIS